MKIRAAAITLTLSLALVPLSSVTALADANPANHGHHYGQLKHPRHSPPPRPVPPPAPTPAPTAPPRTPAGSSAQGSTSTALHASLPSTVIGEAPSGLPGSGLEHPQGSIRPSAAPAPPFPWVVEGLLPALFLIWFLLLAAAIRRRRRDQRLDA